MGTGGGGLDEGVGKNVGHLGGEGDHPVVVVRRGDGEPAKAQRRQHLLAPLQKVDVIEDGGHQHHGLATEQGGAAVLEAGELGARHGMAAHEGEAVFFCQREAGCADLPLDAGGIHYQGVRPHQMGVGFQPFHTAARIDGQQDQVALADGGFIQLAVDRAGHHGELEHIFVALGGVNGVAFHGVGTGHGAADETQAEDTNDHTIASLTRRTRRATSSNWAGVRD